MTKGRASVSLFVYSKRRIALPKSYSATNAKFFAFLTIRASRCRWLPVATLAHSHNHRPPIKNRVSLFLLILPDAQPIINGKFLIKKWHFFIALSSGILYIKTIGTRHNKLCADTVK